MKLSLRAKAKSLAAGTGFLAGLTPMGTVVVAEGATVRPFELGEFHHIASVSAGWDYLAGLRGDGTVIAARAGGESFQVPGWTDMVDVACGGEKPHFLVGLRADGRVFSYICPEEGRTQKDLEDARSRCEVGGWTRVVGIAASKGCTVGVREDGTVLVAGPMARQTRQVEAWREIIDVAVGWEHVAGLRADGRVLSDCIFDAPQNVCKTENWQGIQAIAAGDFHTVGLNSEHLLTAGENEMFFPPSRNGFAGWDSIHSITAAGWHTAALCPDGSVMTTNKYLREKVAGWRLWVPD